MAAVNVDIIQFTKPLHNLVVRRLYNASSYVGLVPQVVPHRKKGSKVLECAIVKGRKN